MAQLLEMEVEAGEGREVVLGKLESESLHWICKAFKLNFAYLDRV